MMWGRLIGLSHFFSDQEWGGTEYRSLLVCEERLFTCTGELRRRVGVPSFRPERFLVLFRSSFPHSILSYNRAAMTTPARSIAVPV